MAINHSGNNYKATNIYVKKDWCLIDIANGTVLDYLLS